MLKLRHTDDDLVEVGLDEAGRGSFWGPIMAGAVIWPAEASWTDTHRKLGPQIRDSKRIAPKKRERIAAEIKELAVAWGIGMVGADEIDENGIQWANQEAFRRALAAVGSGSAIAAGNAAAGGAGMTTESAKQTAPIDLRSSPQRLLIDGVIGMPGGDAEQHNIVDGDALYLPIAAASILAKVEHDHWIRSYCATDTACAEHYDLLHSNGYGTKKHRDGLGIYGAHQHHRRTFVRKYIPSTGEPCKIKLGK